MKIDYVFLTSVNVLIENLLIKICVFIMSWEIDFYGDIVNDLLYQTNATDFSKMENQ